MTRMSEMFEAAKQVRQLKLGACHAGLPSIGGGPVAVARNMDDVMAPPGPLLSLHRQYGNDALPMTLVFC